MVKLNEIILTGLALGAAPLGFSSAWGEEDSFAVRDFNDGIRPVLERYCFECHGREKVKGEVDLTGLSSWADFEGDPELIEEMIEVLDKNEMPPEEEVQPGEEEREFLVSELRKAFANSVNRDQAVIPMRLRRMNRFEYGNAVRDLFDLKSWVYSINDRIIRDHSDYFRPESGEMPKVVRVGNRIMGLQQLLENRLLGVMAFPKDPPAENGFNNRSDHLSLSPVLMESFLELSRSIVHAENFDENCGVWHELFDDPLSPRSRVQKASILVDRAAAEGSTGLTISAWIRPRNLSDQWQTIVRREDSWRRQLLAIGRTGKTWGLWIGAGISGKYEVFGASVDPKILGDGKWHHVAGTFDGKEINLYLDGREIGRKAMVGKLHSQSTGPMSVGSHGNEPFYGDLNDVRIFRSGLVEGEIQSIAVGGKNVANDELMGSWNVPKVVRTEIEESVEEIARARIEKFLLKAFHSPPDDKTLELYAGYFDRQYEKSGGFTASMKDVVSATLASPRFIFVHNEREEASPNQTSFNLAARLAMFLWSSIPDEELLELAGKGELQDVEVLSEQVDRMLNHGRVKNFCDSFAPQWLKLNNLVSASPDFKSYRDYYFGGDDKISYKRGMHMMLEPLLNFETVFIENRPISDLVDSDFTYQSHLLSEWYEGRAATYGINVNLRDIEYTRTPVTDRRNGGVITTGAVMVMTSSPFRSLPITRGSWVSSVIFNDPPEPPPDDIPDLRADDKTLQEEGLTVRQKLNQHSSDARCASCHVKIDPLGFALENYDLLGRWRDHYRTGLKVDASGELFGKHEFTDVVGFKDAILAEKDLFAKAFVGHLLSYALGRELTLPDRVAVGEIVEASKGGGYRMRDVIKNIAVHPIITQITKP